MSLFKKRPAAALDERPFVAQLRSAIDARQRQFAAYLGRKTQYWDRASKIIALALFCLFFGGLSLLLILKAIR
jgi:hypothetical protein